MAQTAPDEGSSHPLSRGQRVDMAEALALGMPRLHEPFTDCQCVGMTWAVGAGEPLVLEIPRADITAVRHDVLDGPHELRLVLASGEEMLLEQAPCRYVALAAAKYSSVLGIPEETVDVDGALIEDPCGPPIVDIESMESMRKRAMAAEQSRLDDRQRARMELVSAKGEPQVVLGVRSSLNAAVMGAGQCFGRAPVAPETRVDVKVSTRGSEVRFKTRPIGVEAVDRCFDELGDQVALPAGKAKVHVAYVRAGE
jgi:hypothetical protein